ncbi:MAG: CoA transferase [Ectothiorhodospiraceae bacterium]|nr:CoA transferase [Chromatiales bacterium]MCP5157506.1 CoA transferase [Ectothiorhodospiraceae bacterium]
MTVPVPAAHLPLDGVRVVEVGTSVAAPYATWILAALGADVVKVERPGKGDDARQWGELFADGRSSIFEALNRDKRGISVDLKDPAALERLRSRVIAGADVVLQNLRPGHVARYGLDAATLTAADPRLVYCNIWAFGASGPLKDHPGYDPLMQAYGGIMSVTGEMGRAPVRVGTSIIDMGTGMWCAIGILAALRRREVTGLGCVVDASLFETALGWMTYHATGYQASGENPVRRGSGAPGMVPYQAFRCADGYLMIAAPNDKLFVALCGVLGRPQWPEDPRFASNQARYANQPALIEAIEAITVTADRAHWRRLLEAAGIPCAPDQTTSEMLADPQTRALGILQHLPGNPLELMGLPLSFDGTRPPLREHAPALGEHDRALLGDDTDAH